MRYIESENQWYVIIDNEWVKFNGKENEIKWA